MVLNFKVNRNDQISFLWCSSLRIENTLDKKNLGTNEHYKACEIDKIRIKPPEYVNLFKYSVSGKPVKPYRNSVCLNCDNKIESYRLYEISFKHLIESHDNRKRDKEFFKKFENLNMSIYLFDLFLIQKLLLVLR